MSSRLALGGAVATLLPPSLGCGPMSGALPVIPNSPSNSYDLTFASFPALQTTGGATLVQIDATSGSVPVAIVRTGATTAVALQAICTHAGCLVNPFDGGSRTFSCPCHGSVFAEDGTVVRGPAQFPLSPYPAAVGADAITVSVS